MKLSLGLLGFAGLAATAPTTNSELDVSAVRRSIENIARDTIDSATSNELFEGGCRNVTFIFARGSTEVGNIGNDVSGPLSLALKAKYGDSFIATQGVDYPASLLTNLLPKGCSPKGIAHMAGDIQLAATQCPDSQIIVGGYSQGAACTHAAVKMLDPATISHIIAAVTFGDTKRLQSGGKISPIDPARTKIFCAKGDLVCDGLLITDAAHTSYTADVPAAVDFLS